MSDARYFFVFSLIIVLSRLASDKRIIPGIFKRIKFFLNSFDFEEAIALKQILEENNPYYRSLSEKGKVRFIRKCFSFMKSKNFVGMYGLEITDEIIGCISGTAAQLTMGFKKSSLNYYHTIKVFPETFYSGMAGYELKGGATSGGTLLLSWEDFKEGYADSSDRYNLGLHEMAHALRVELKYGKDFDRRFANYTNQWFEIALPEFEMMNKGTTSFLRDYASTNMEEFFAVCVEHFFEVPEEFRENLPDIYNHLCYLLNQDPLNVSNDFKIDAQFADKVNGDKKRKPIPQKVRTAYEYYAWHWSFTFIVAGTFIGLPIVLVEYSQIILDYSNIVLFISTIAIVTTSFRSFFYKKGIFLFPHLLMFSVIGVAVNLLAWGLLLNQIVPVEETKLMSYKIRDFSYINNQSGQYLIFDLEHNALHNRPEFRKFNYHMQYDIVTNADSIVFFTTKGIFGIPVVNGREIRLRNDISRPSGGSN